MPGKPFLLKLRAPLLMGLAGALAGGGLGHLGRWALAKPAPAATPPPAATATATATAAAASKSPAVPSDLSGKPASRSAPGAPVASDEAGVLSAALAGEKGVDYWLHLFSVADKAPGHVLGRLMDSLKNEPAVRDLLATRWAQRDPEGMFAALKLREPKDPSDSDSQSGNQEAQLQRIVVDEWFRQNPESLISALGGIRGLDSMRPAKERLLSLLASKDLRQTLGLLVNWEMSLSGLPGRVLTPWLRAHPQEAMRLILEQKPSARRRGGPGPEILLEIARAVAFTDPAAALSMSPAVNPALRDVFRNAGFQDNVFGVWALRDPAAARDWLSSPELDWKTRNRLGPRLLEHWAKTDPSAALAWAESHLTGRTRMQAGLNLIPALAAQDPGGPLEYVRKLNPGPARDEALLKVTDSLLGDTPKPEALKAFQQITALSDPSLRQTALAAAASPMMDVAPQEYLAWLASPEGAAAPWEAFSRTADSLAEKDGASAMTWAAGLRPDLAGGLRKNILSTWLRENPEAARTWVSALPDGPERRSSVILTTSSIAYQRNLGNSTAWLATLPASDHPAILDGLSNAGDLDHALKTELQAKYR